MEKHAKRIKLCFIATVITFGATVLLEMREPAAIKEVCLALQFTCLALQSILYRKITRLM